MVRHVRRRSTRLARTLLVGGGCLLLSGAGTPVLAGPHRGVPPGIQLEPTGSLTIREPGTVIDGLAVDGAIDVQADNVVVRNTRVSYGGIHSIRVASGVRGTRIEDTDVWCTNPRGNGVVFGGYTAVRVSVRGCRNDFVSTSPAHTLVVDSESDGEAVEFAASGEPPAAPAPAVTTPAPTSDTSVMWERAGTRNTGHRYPLLETITAEEAKERLKERPLLERVRITSTLRLSGDEGKGWTFRDVAFEGGRPYLVHSYIGQEPFTGSLSERPRFEHVTLIGDGVRHPRGDGTSACFYGHDAVFVQVHAYGCVDIFKPYDRVLIERSYAHSVHKPADAHVDIVQIRQASDTQIRGNSFDARVGYGTSVGSEANAVLQTGSLTGSIRRVQFTDNHVVGGSYTLRLGSTGYPGANEAGHSIDYTFRRNRHGRRFTYGPVDGSTNTASSLGGSRYDHSNVWDDAGRPVEP